MEVAADVVAEQPAPAAELKAVYGSAKHEAALVGTQVVRAGDTLRDGRAVERIERRALIAKP